MPLSRELLNQIIEILVPHVNVSDDDRRALIQRAFFGEAIVDQLTYSGQAVTFAMNCVLHLKKYNTESAIVQLLETLRDYYVGVDVKAKINALLAEINPAAPTDTPSTATSLVLDAPLFISYSRKDFDFVNRLRGSLKTRGVPYWIDQEGLSPGTSNWERAIRAAIQTSSAVLWIVSPAAYESEYVSSELAVAEMYKRKIYPVWADGDNWIACAPLGKHNIQFVDMRASLYAAGLEQLFAALGKADSEYIVPVEKLTELPPDAAPRNPYKGLNAFTEADIDDFFGREALVASLAERLQKQLAENKARFLAVLGPSGAGKSSVVMAGLLPALKNKNAIRGSDTWHYLPTITPGAHPMESLAGAFATLMPSADSGTILRRLYTMGVEAVNFACDMLAAARVVLYVDQFEELFTLAKDDGERQAFISLISGAATEPNGKLIVLLSMRADFLDYPLNYPQLGPLFNAYNELVQPMSIPELRDAIQKPAQQSGLTFDDGLVGDIVFALRGQDKALAGALPLLQFTLERLYEERDGNTLTRDAYERMGGVSGAIGTHSESVFRSLPQSAQDTLGRVFLPLVNIDEETGEPTRRRAPLGTIVANPDAQMLVDAFVDARLLQTGRDDGLAVKAYLEVTHEALLRSWDTLVTWIATTRDDLRLLRQVRVAAEEWDTKHRPDYLLWPQERLTLVYAMQARLNPELNEVEQDFIEPEQERLYREIAILTTDHERRRDIGDRLAVIGDTRHGVGVKDGIPQIEWLSIETLEEPVTLKTDEREIGPVVIKPFFIAKYQVTYAQYQAFIEAEDGYHNTTWWQDFPEKYRPQGLANQRTKIANAPRDTISWYQSVAFARWLDAKYRELGLYGQFGNGDWQVRLPTEWEWQWAAQSGTEARAYPWGEWQEGYANTSEAGLSRTTTVGMYPHGAASCGSLDMSGNLWEWCLNDRESPDIITGFSNGKSKVLCGGSFYGLQDLAAASSRNPNHPNYANHYYGVRLVLSAPMASHIELRKW